MHHIQTVMAHLEEILRSNIGIIELYLLYL